jgi:4-hydroxy-tetrahydrodipicolinate reductase
MNIALIGYGKMGHEIEKISLERGHKIALIIDLNNFHELDKEHLALCDVAINFSTPDSAFNSILRCFDAKIPLVCGTTGWLTHMPEIKERCLTENQTFFYASNFSLGVNLFFRLNKQLAAMMNKFAQYEVSMTEVHHIHKLDAPSGTAITLAEDIMEEIDRKKQWLLSPEKADDAITIKSVREGEVPGIHTINYESEFDYIEITHSAHNRQGLALGAVLAAEFIKEKTGFLGMDDLLKDTL